MYGFFIVESTTAPGWQRACDETVAPDMVNNSLPHRSAAKRAAIADAFLGITTWTSVCKRLGVDLIELTSREQIDARGCFRAVQRECDNDSRGQIANEWE